MTLTSTAATFDLVRTAREGGWRAERLITRAAVLQALIDWSAEVGERTVAATARQLASRAGVGARTIVSATAELENLGAIEIDRSGRQLANRYTLRFEHYNTEAQQEAEQTGQQKDAAPKRKAAISSGTEDWQRAVDLLRKETQQRLGAFERKLDQLVQALGQNRLESEQPRQTTQNGDTPAPAAIPTMTPADTGSELLEHLDARLATFAEALANRIEQAIAKLAPPPADRSDAEPDTPTSDTEAIEQTRGVVPTPPEVITQTDTAADVPPDDHQTGDIGAGGAGGSDEEAARDALDDGDRAGADDEGDLGDLDDRAHDQDVQDVQDVGAQQAGTAAPATPPTKRGRGRPPNDPGAPSKIQARADRLFDKLLRLVDKPPEEQNTALAMLAATELEAQQEHYAPGTILRANRNEIFKRLKDRSAQHPQEHSQTAVPLVDLWIGTYNALLEEDTTALNTTERADAERRAKAPVVLDLSEKLQWAHAVLAAAAAGHKEYPWRQTSWPLAWQAVSVALALAWGRRQAEIHCTADARPLADFGELAAHLSTRLGHPPLGPYLLDTYKPDSEHEVLFVGRGDRLFGQVKFRKDSPTEAEWQRQPIRATPTLLPAEMIFDGLDWLERAAQRIDDENDVNGKFSVELNAFLKRLWPEPVVPHTDQKTQCVEYKPLTYRDLRELYTACCLENWVKRGVPKGALPLYLKHALGHGPRGDATVNYCGFALVEGSLSQI